MEPLARSVLGQGVNRRHGRQQLLVVEQVTCEGRQVQEAPRGRDVVHGVPSTPRPVALRCTPSSEPPCVDEDADADADADVDVDVDVAVDVDVDL